MSKQPDAPSTLSKLNLAAGERETARLEAFSDGIFGVAITLLAIEISVSKGIAETNEGLIHGLAELWPKYVSYFVTFVQILFMWMAHHTIMKQVRRVNTSLMLANGLLLLVVILVPFPAKTLGEFIHTEAARTAIVFYTGYFVLVNVAFNVFLKVILYPGNQLLAAEASPLMLDGLRRSQTLGFFCNVAIFGTAFVSTWGAMALNVTMWIYWVALARERREASLPS